MNRNELDSKSDEASNFSDDIIVFTEDDVWEFVNDMEDRVNKIVKKLENVTAIENIYKIEEAYNELKELSQDLY